MKYLSWDETLFKEIEVFDPDYLPEEYTHRETQLSRLSSNLKPALRNSRPINSLCLGPPGTGKTTAVKMLFKEIEEMSNENSERMKGGGGINAIPETPSIPAIPVYVNCQIMNSRQRVFAKIFEKLHGYELPSYGTPFQKLYYNTMNKLAEKNKVLIVALDDLNFLLDDQIMNETLYALLKAHEEIDGVKIGIIGIATDLKLSARLDERTGSIFHPDEIYFPPYGRDEVESILKNRVRAGFYENVISDEAFQKIVDLTYENTDIRLGLHLLKMSGLEAEKRASLKIGLEDVEAIIESGKKIFLRKVITVLGDEERVLLESIYTGKEKTSGDLFKEFGEKINKKISYTKFYDMLTKLESMKLIDTMFDKKKRGRTRIVSKRYDPKIVIEALQEF